MRIPKRALLFGVSSLVLVAMLATAVFIHSGGSARAAAANSQSLQNLTLTGTGGFTNGASGLAGETPNQQLPSDTDRDQHTNAKYANAPTMAPNPAPSGVSSSSATGTGFRGLTHYDTRTRDGGNSFSLEPPDQGLCVGNGDVLETVNDVMVVFDTAGNRITTPTSMNTFFGLPFAINRTTGVRGDFLSDPKCYYDAGTNRWFLTMLQEDPAPSVRAHTLIAVSQTGDPTGAWTDFSIDATDDGLNGTPSNPNCPCFGDQPLIGADAYGFYISTNEFGDSTGFNGAQVYAISKSGLVAAATAKTPALPVVVHINAGAIATPDAGGIWYSIQPATAPGTGGFALGNHGTEYFLSALQFGPAPLDNRIAAWAMTNTSSLSKHSPSVSLIDTVIGTETYGVPATGNFAATQKPGNTPLADSLAKSNVPENQLNANDDRMNQVVYANGMLWSGVNTVAGKNTGIAYFIVSPQVSPDGTQVSATVANQGYVSLGGDSVLFPSIGVNSAGQGVMTFTLSGQHYYPSSAYVTIDATSGAGAINIAGAGVGPADGFTGYAAYGGNGVERWGDYSAAVADAGGSIWFASEYIAQTCTDAQYAADSTCGGTRTLLANWATFIGHVSF